MLDEERRGALAASWLGSVLNSSMPPDTALPALKGLIDQDWLDLIAQLRAAGTIGLRLFLPRPGDPRGQRSPDPEAGSAAAVLGWVGPTGIQGWTTVQPSAPWVSFASPPVRVPTESVQDADRHLRAAILKGAEEMAELQQAVTATERRGQTEQELRRWSDAPLESDNASLAAKAVPLLLALASAPPAGLTVNAQDARTGALRALDPVVRTAVDVAYSTA